MVHRRETVGEVKEVSLRKAIGHVLRDLRTRDHKTLREVSEKGGRVPRLPLRSRAWPEGGQLRAAGVHLGIAGSEHIADAAHGRGLPRFVEA